MYRKQLFTFLVAATVLVMGGFSALAQTGPVRGIVKMKQADGTTVPVANAVLDAYRLDLPGKMENVKTNNRGEFSIIGLYIVGKYVLSVSAPNAQPRLRTNIKAGLNADYEIILDPGDGRRYTMEEAKKMASGDEDAAAGNTGGGESAEDKAKREEMIRKNAEITESNKKAEESNAIYNRAFKEGNAAYTAKRYEEAAAKYSEAITADPDHPGAPVIYTNRSLVLRMSAVDRYNAAIKAKDDGGIAAAKKDWEQSASDAKIAVEKLKAQSAPAEPAAAAAYKDQLYRALQARASVMRFFVTKVDRTQADAGLAAYREYLAVEPDSAAKLKTHLEGARMLFDAGEVDKAVAEYQKILTDNPDNVDAMLGAGLALFGTGDTAKYQEAANYLQRFVDKAPDTHELKADAKAVLEELKNQNVKPQKAAPGGRRRG